ncbi:MAG: aminotransferase class I/II-fold pyridoxal phosphate-dependent enzyme [Gemmatimonadota bacterium]|nr:aminotransferase class I/II-fold pyridoxal phosphate-dependent enzyme [Gemmatimonadota bacterium]
MVRPGLPSRLESLPPYPLAGIPEAKARLAAAGRDVLDLGAGDPGLPVPEVAVEALREAAGRNELQKYAFQRGLPAFRRSIVDFMARRYDVELDPDREVLPLIGSKEGLAHLALAALDPGDTVVIPDPGYAPYFGGPHFADARLETAPLLASNGFLLDPAAIDAARGEPRLVYANYPNNPTGATAELGYVQALLETTARRGGILAYDNAYAEIAFDGYRPPSLTETDGWRENGLEFHSLSKSFNMTGWRLGWVCGGAELIGRLSRVKGFFDTGPYLGIQSAGSAVLDHAEAFLVGQVERLRARRDAAVDALRSVGVEVEAPRATLYLWFRTPAEGSSREFVERLMEQEALLLLPGSGLGAAGEGWVRASLTLPRDGYGEVAARIARAL